MGYKVGNTYTNLSPYATPTYIVMNRNKNSESVKMRVIKIKIKVRGNFKITIYHFEEEADDRINGRKIYLSSKQEKNDD